MAVFSCLVAASAVLTGLLAPTPDGSVAIVKGRHGNVGSTHFHLARLPHFQVWPRLTISELKHYTVMDGSLPNVGVTDFMHLDARTPYVMGKGGINLDRCFTDVDNNTIAFDMVNDGGVALSFIAKPGQARYLVDFQVSLGPKSFAMSGSVDGGFQATTVDQNTHHLLYVVDCNGGTHKVEMWSPVPSIVVVTGVDVALVK